MDHGMHHSQYGATPLAKNMSNKLGRGQAGRAARSSVRAAALAVGATLVVLAWTTSVYLLDHEGMSNEDSKLGLVARSDNLNIRCAHHLARI
eukprot:SAG11_NODE_159_length_14027_cov_6.893667_14_plen_92_part_00